MSAPLFTGEERARLARLALRPRRRLPGDAGGERVSGRVGQGTLFADHRPYSAGDDPRYVDWHVAARLGDLVVKRFEAEESLDLLLLLDLSASMAGAKAVTARRLAGALGHLALDHLDRVHLARLPAEGARPLTTYAGAGGLAALLGDLERAPAGGRADLAADLGRLARARRRRSLAVVLSDLFAASDPLEGVRRLRALGHETLVLHVLDPADAVLPVGSALVAVDAEDGRSVEVDVTPEVAEAVARAWRRRVEAVARGCAALGVPCVRAETGRPLWDVLRDLLAQGLVGRRG